MLDQWYQSLETVDREILSSYLADDATIEIQDLSIVQNRDEFIESLDTWEDAIIGGSLSYKFVEAKTSGETITAIVCYKFPSNQMMTEEVFEFQNQLIKKSVQQTLSDNCDGF